MRGSCSGRAAGRGGRPVRRIGAVGTVVLIAALIVAPPGIGGGAGSARGAEPEATAAGTATPPGGAWTLDQALAEAAARHPAVAATRAAVAAARAGEAAAQVYPLDPEATVRGGVRVAPGSGGQAGGAAPGPDVGPVVGIDLTQGVELVDRGALRGAVAAAQTEEARARGRAEAAEVAAAVRGAFGRALRAKALVTGAAASAELSEAMRTVAERRVRAGEAPPLEEALARIDVARSQRALAAAQGELALACAELGAAMGRGAPATPAGDLDLPAAPPSERSLAARSEEHPSLAPVRAARDEALARAELAASRATPDLGIGAFWDMEGDDHMAGVALSLRLPAFDTGAEEAAAARAEAAALDAAAHAGAATRAAMISAARARLIEALRVATAARGDLPPVQEALALLRVAWERGQVRQAEVLVLRRELLDAERDAIDARAAAWDAWAALEAAVGAPL